MSVRTGTASNTILPGSRRLREAGRRWTSGRKRGSLGGGGKRRGIPMTEAEWLACTDPERMLECLQVEFLWRGGYDRQLQLFGVACCRAVWHLLEDERYRQAVETLERYADGQATGDEL